MGEFFKFFNRFDSGCKRVGLRMLLVATLFTVNWIRSLAVCDEVRFHTASDSMHIFVSTDSSMIWERRDGVDSRQAPSLSFMELFTGLKFIDVFSSDPRHSRWNWKWNRCGFGAGAYNVVYGDEKYMIRHTCWCAPYWSIVLPLTALSAWLLLSKRPQPTKPEPPQESAA